MHTIFTRSQESSGNKTYIFMRQFDRKWQYQANINVYSKEKYIEHFIVWREHATDKGLCEIGFENNGKISSIAYNL